jgi:hypothetical protein
MQRMWNNAKRGNTFQLVVITWTSDVPYNNWCIDKGLNI